MKLAEILSNLDSTDDDLCIVARRPWSGDAEAMLVRPDENGRLPSYLKEAGYEYFLEVQIIRDEVLGERSGQLNAGKRVAVVLHYAEHDAWPDWFHQFCEAEKRDN